MKPDRVIDDFKVKSTILAIDPGPLRSGVCIVNFQEKEIKWIPGMDVGGGDDISNDTLSSRLIELFGRFKVDVCVIEGMEHRGFGSYFDGGVLQTCVWIGEFASKCCQGVTPVFLINPRDIRTELFGSARGEKGKGNAQRRRALEEIYGEAKPKGGKGNKGWLYELSNPRVQEHNWCALSVAHAYTWEAPLRRPGYFFTDRQAEKKEEEV